MTKPTDPNPSQQPVEDGQARIESNESSAALEQAFLDPTFIYSPTPVVITNTKFDIIYSNQAAENLLHTKQSISVRHKIHANLLRHIGSKTSVFINWIQSHPQRGLEVLLSVSTLTRHIAFGSCQVIDGSPCYVFNFLPSSKLTFLGVDNAVCQAVFEYSRLSIYITDSNRKIISSNPGFAEMFGYSRNELIGQTDTPLYTRESNEEIAHDAFSKVKEMDFWKGRVTATHNSGETFAVKLSVIAAPSSNHDSDGTMYVHILDDIGDQVEFESLLRTTAETDALTGLRNRLGFNKHFESAMSEAVRTGGALYVFFMDLDAFKPINDTYGHSIGDELLISVANRLTNSLKKKDFIARLGGDEFVIIPSSELNWEQVKNIANKLVSSLSEKYCIRDIELQCKVSIGVACYPDNGLTADNIIEAADTAMYTSKKNGGNQATIYTKP
jgi:diguanylate cyclase (GGDEF)-like protein/PAS domain S-box-containing protein